MSANGLWVRRGSSICVFGLFDREKQADEGESRRASSRPGVRTPAGRTRPPLVAPGVHDSRTAGRGGIRVISEIVNKLNQTETTIEGYLQPGIQNRSRNAPNYNEEKLWAILRAKHPQMTGWEAAHLWGPGFGDEAAAGILLAPKSVNQRLQNHLIERFLRKEVRPWAEARGLRLFLRAKATSKPRNRWGGIAMDSVQYDFFVEHPDGHREQIGRYQFSVSDPPSGRIHDLVIKGPTPSTPARRRRR
jgi:Bacterial toxin 4